MKKTLAIAAAALLVVGLASTAFAHGPRGAGAYGPGYGHMRGMGQMMGGQMMSAHMGWTGEGPPCLNDTTQGTACPWGTEGQTVTPEQQKQFKERSRTFVERYIERFLPEYKLVPKAETPQN